LIAQLAPAPQATLTPNAFSREGTPSYTAAGLQDFFFPLLSDETSWILVLTCSPTGGPDGAGNCPSAAGAPSGPIIGDNSKHIFSLLQERMFTRYPALFDETRVASYFAYNGTVYDALKTQYVSADGLTTFAVWTASRSLSDATRYGAYHHMRSLLRSADVRALCPGCDFGTTGQDALTEDTTGAITNNIARAEVFTVPIALLIFVYMTRSWRFLLVTGACIGTVILTAFAAMRRVSEATTPPQAITPQFVQVMAMAVAIDYGLFFFTRFNSELESRRTAWHRRRAIALAAAATAAAAGGSKTAVAATAAARRHEQLAAARPAFATAAGTAAAAATTARGALLSVDPEDPHPLDDRPLRALVRASVGATLRHSGHVVLVSGCTLIISFCGFFISGCSFLIQPAVANVLAITLCILTSLSLTPAAVLAFPAFFTDYNLFPAAFYACCCPGRRRHMLGDTDFTGDEVEAEDPELAQSLAAGAAEEIARDTRTNAAGAHGIFALQSPRMPGVAPGGGRRQRRRGAGGVGASRGQRESDSDENDDGGAHRGPGAGGVLAYGDSESSIVESSSRLPMPGDGSDDDDNDAEAPAPLYGAGYGTHGTGRNAGFSRNAGAGKKGKKKGKGERTPMRSDDPLNVIYGGAGAAADSADPALYDVALAPTSAELTSLAHEDKQAKMRRSCWFKLGSVLVRFPYNLMCLLVVFGVLGALSSRLFTMKLSSSVSLALPERSEARHTLDVLSSAFGPGLIQPMSVLIVYTPPDQTTPRPVPIALDDVALAKGAAVVAALAEGTALLPTDLTSPFYWNGTAVLTQQRALELIETEPVYKALWGAQGAQTDAGGPDADRLQACTRIAVQPSFDPETSEIDEFVVAARRLFDTIQHDAAQAGERIGMFQLHLSGYKPSEYDTIQDARSKFPLMLGLTTATVLVAVAILLQSVFVPVRLLLTLIFPMAATFGLAVLVYQDGALNFLGIRNVSNATGAFYWDIPIFAFIVLLGLALDYDVFIISRIIEYRVEGYTNEAAIALGLYDTAPIITAAGLIMAITFGSLLVMDSGAVQQTGWLLVTSVLLDTFLVRSFIVPCVMSFADKIGWWPRRVPQYNLKDADGSSGMHIEAATSGRASAF
jgi:uncharacterized membrane protein YdfJ with MMPL/SSD domain